MHFRTKTAVPARTLMSVPLHTFVTYFAGCHMLAGSDVHFLHWQYVAGMTLFGLSLSGIVIMSCTVFCCARMFPCCYWIGIPCKVGRKCGGDLPTKRRKQPEVLRAVFYCILGSCGVL